MKSRFLWFGGFCHKRLDRIEYRHIKLKKNALFRRSVPLTVKWEKQCNQKQFLRVNKLCQSFKCFKFISSPFYCFKWTFSEFKAGRHHRPSSIAWRPNPWTYSNQLIDIYCSMPPYGGPLAWSRSCIGSMRNLQRKVSPRCPFLQRLLAGFFSFTSRAPCL
jgi:hypothetical protein